MPINTDTPQNEVFSIESYLAGIESASYENSLNRTEKLLNTVEFTSGSRGKVSVTRLITESVAKINRQHEYTLVNNAPIEFSRIYAVRYSTVFQDMPINKVLGIVGVTSENKAFLLTSTFNLAVQSAGGENIETLRAMIATVTKAKNLAEKHGMLDDYHFCYSNVKTEIRAKTVVSVPVENI